MIAQQEKISRFDAHFKLAQLRIAKSVQKEEQRRLDDKGHSLTTDIKAADKNPGKICVEPTWIGGQFPAFAY
jgi:hypothetical protein